MKKEMEDSFENSRICFLSNFPPKECGIATFTRDLAASMNQRFNPKLKSKVVALNSEYDNYKYTNEVILQLEKENIEDYINIAKKINGNEKIKLVSIQHEFGIFGGDYGNYIVPFLETLEKPSVITFHSVLPQPDPMRKKVVQAIASRCSAIVVMANVAVDILNNDYGINRNKIHVIHHGTPNVAFEKNLNHKKSLKLDKNIVLSTFGLLSGGKGIEYMIEAMPELVKKYPNILYLIIGETHPVVKKNEGEIYRDYLKKRIKELKLTRNIKFLNKYMTLQEIINYLQASDIYICTNLEKNQITSGTLAYAISTGKAVISTPSIYAEEILSDNRGVLVKFKNSKSYAEAIDKILSDDEFKSKIENNAYTYSRAMTWPNVAARYLSIFNKVVKLREEITEKFPSIKLDHLDRMTDEIGIIQFANYSKPMIESGYTVDDNSRALIFTTLHNKIYESQKSRELSRIYLNFLKVTQEKNGNFKNNLQNEEEKTKPYSEDAYGRAILALGFTVENSTDSLIKDEAVEIIEKSLPYLKNLQSLRAKSFSLIGLCHYFKSQKNPHTKNLIKQLADLLVETYKKESSENWKWFESVMTYSNAKLSESLFFAYEITGEEKYLKIAKESLKFLSEITFIEDKLYPIGQNGWYRRNGERAFFDQQPVDVTCMVQSFITAFRVTNDEEYYKKAVIAFNWFLGRNHLKQMMYDENTGGCYDGLGRFSVNLNQGSESTISYHISRIFLEEINKNGTLNKIS